jgi:PAS domain S-box-containing protein
MRILLIDRSYVFRAEFADLLQRSGIGTSCIDEFANLDGIAEKLDQLRPDICFVERRLLAASPGGAASLLHGPSLCPVVVLRDGPPSRHGRVAGDGPAEDELDKSELTPALLRYAIRAALRGGAADAAARKAEGLLRLTEETAGIGIWDWDLRTGRVAWSPNLYRLFGVSPSRAEGDLYGAFFENLHPEDREPIQAAIQAALEGSRPYQTHARILRPSAAGGNRVETRWIACRGEVMRDARGAAIRMIGINMDVTDQQAALSEAEQRRAAADLQRRLSETRFRTVFESAADCMFIVSARPNGGFAYEAANPVALVTAGVSLDALLGRTPHEVLGPVKGGEMEAGLHRVCATGQAFHYEPSWALPQGEVTFDARYLPLRADDGRVTDILGIARNITSLRRLESWLQQTQKLDAVGQLAGGIAHDFNDVLAAVQSCLLLLRKHFDAPQAEELLAQGLRSVGHGKTLTDRLLGFVRQAPAAPGPLDIGRALQDGAELIRRTLGSGVKVELDVAPALPPVHADGNQFDLALLNLAINARDAMPGGGLLKIRVRLADVSAEYVMLDVADTGTGMPPGVLARVREPFYTTKAAGRGTGLGLTMVDDFVQAFGGDLRIASEPGVGTTVTLLLRRADRPAGECTAA